MTDGAPQIGLFGVGNEYRRDQGVGLVALRALVGEGLPPHVQTSEARSAGIGLLADLRGLDAAIIITAAATGAEPGTVTVLKAAELEDAAASATDLPGTLADLLDVGALAFPLPDLWFVLVQPAEDLPGTGLSLPVGQAVREATARVREIIARLA
ncbi:MAG: hydrogenase maturation protease [Armatimonadetes bacterium]|nr:hydrogenase maturation protease [Armatimonadota bacterium]